MTNTNLVRKYLQGEWIDEAKQSTKKNKATIDIEYGEEICGKNCKAHIYLNDGPQGEGDYCFIWSKRLSLADDDDMNPMRCKQCLSKFKF